MKRRKAVRVVQRFFGLKKRVDKVEARHRDGRLELVVRGRSGNGEVPGRVAVISHGRSWLECVRRLMPAKDIPA